MERYNGWNDPEWIAYYGMDDYDPYDPFDGSSDDDDVPDMTPYED